WACSVCEFNNLEGVAHCSLCLTPRDTYLIEANDSVTTFRHGQVSLQPPLVPRPVMNTLFYLHSVLPEDLNPRQRSARMRRQWTRAIDADGAVTWACHFTNAPCSTSSHVVQVLKPTSDDSSSVELSWLPLHALAGQDMTVLGETLPTTTWTYLVELAALPFSVKFAWFLHQAASLVLPQNIKVKCSRDRLLPDAVDTLLGLDGPMRCSSLRFEFQGEVGRDAGGLQREWYMCAAEAFLACGLFAVANRDDNSYFINVDATHALQSSSLAHLQVSEAFRAAGRFVGRALLDGQMLTCPLNPILFKVLLGTPLTLDDVESLDRSVYKSLVYLLTHEDVDALTLTFSVSEPMPSSGHYSIVDLIPNGQDIAVTDANKRDYVDRMVRYLLFDRVQTELLALVQGVYDIIPRELLLPFDHKELELLLCGLTDIDVVDWETNTTLSSDLIGTSLVHWFWDIVRAMSQVDRAKLLQYTTGCSRVPVQGFKGLTSYDGKISRFALRGVAYFAGAYPRVHTCFNRIDLPRYPTKVLLEDAIKTLLLSNATGFTIE
ncbi:hypothetical protein As57867_014995, partial [Aphanomyces stellatus]